MSYLNIKKLLIYDNKTKLLDISLEILSSTALIGQSGSGKSLTLKSILNLLPSNLLSSYEVDANFELTASNIGFVPQNPFTSLSPMTKIQKQFFCTQKRKVELLELVGLESWVLNRFPSQLSGGQLQRVVIAISLSTNPKLLLLDEPTTALDNESKTTILKLLEYLQEKLDILLLFVTHDIHSIKDICKNLVIIKDGSIVEKGLTQDILDKPENSYTQHLLESTFENKNFRE
ncbi:MAG: ABC transporter ATP-binding protein [Campylobacteraceae bacterium]|nr:ABC transporter ATP-binding protein [Campylobacteraceae bacterium]